MIALMDGIWMLLTAYLGLWFEHTVCYGGGCMTATCFHLGGL